MFKLLFVDMNSNIIRLKDAPKHFNVSRATIWRWRKQGLIKTYCVGSVAYIDTKGIFLGIEDG